MDPNMNSHSSQLITGLILLWAGFTTLAESNSTPPQNAPPAIPASLSTLHLPILEKSQDRMPDWLVHSIPRRAKIWQGEHPGELVLNNGLIRRTFLLKPNGATVALDNLVTGASLLRGVKPEALITINGKEFAIGGLVGQPNYAYLLPEWESKLQSDPASFRLTGFDTGPTRAPFGWARKRHATGGDWPPSGVRVSFTYSSPDSVVRPVRVTVHYELYDGLPVYCKWITVENLGLEPITVDTFTSELIAAVEAESAVDERVSGLWRLPAIQVFSDYSFKGGDAITANRVAQWVADPAYTTQVNYLLKQPHLLVCRPPLGPGLELKPGKVFESFRSWVLVHDSSERERQGLAVRRFHRVMAPWVTENPIMMHVRSADSAVFRKAVDQCAETGFEMIIYTFGSGLDMENEDPSYLARIRADVDYAHARGIEVGAYSLLASRHVSDQDDAINPETGKPGGAIFGHSPCLASRWGLEYFRKIRHFIEATGLDLLEHDGSYPGDVCASNEHPGHRGLADSQWAQWRLITDFYQWCRARGVYLNVPDYYFLAGSTKTAMGYRETNWSLPRGQQIIHGRQNIFDGTWEKTPSMGWMFVPLVEYQGGGAAATLEPLSEHLDAYQAHLLNNFGAGVQACYRGPRLYDTEATRNVVRSAVDWFKTYRNILESDIIHLRRADGRDLDAMLHVNPHLEPQALAVFYNPLSQPVERTMRLPLYYAGLCGKIRVREQNGHEQTMALDRFDNLDLPVRVGPRGMTWVVIKR